MLDLHRLRILREVAIRGSLSGAAESLSYTPSAISQHIAALERDLGATLLDRHARGVRLTEVGRVLVGHVDVILAELRAAEASVTAISRGVAGRLRFGSFTTANAILMPRAAAAFRRRSPDVVLELIEIDVDESLQMVAAHELDLALVYEFPVVRIKRPPEVELIHIGRDPLHVALPAAHPLSRRRRLRLTDLGAETWIQGIHRGSTIDVLPRACRQAGFEPTIAFRTDDQMTVRGLVAAGIGIALAPSLTLPATPPGIVTRPLSERSLTRDIMAAIPTSRHRLPAAVAFIEDLRESAATLGAHDPTARPA